MMGDKISNETAHEHSFSTDRPIESREQDLLGRRGFADSIAASVRNFPNIIYFLLFQRDIVEGILREIVPTTGRDYLEKIVQVGFDIPAIERTRLEKVLFARLDQILESKDIDSRFNNHRWGNIFLGGLRSFFENLRDVNRYISSLDFHVALFKNSKTFEVNPVDLIALEVLRVFEPDIYHMLINIKEELTGVAKDYHGGRDIIYERIDKEIKELVNRASESKQAHVLEILTQLFPRIEKMGYGGGFSELWYRELRVCHPDVFDRYFHFAIPSGDISQSELNAVLEAVGERGVLVSKFLDLNTRDLLAVALDRLEAYKEEIDIIHAIPFITALYDIGDSLPDEPSGLFSFGAESHARRIIYWYLMQEKNSEKREYVLKKAAMDSPGLYLPMETVSLEEDRRTREKEPENYLVQDNKILEELKSICIKKIVDASLSGFLENHPKMIYILYHWLKWDDPEQVKTWVNTLVQSSEGALKFLISILNKSTSQSLGDYVGKVHWRTKLQTIEDFVSLDDIKRKIVVLNTEKLGEKEQSALRAFQKALQREKNGISDDDWRHDDDD